MKKWLYVGCAALLIAAVVTVVIWLKMSSLYSANEPTRQLPANACAVLKVNSIPHLISATNDADYNVRAIAAELLANDSSVINETKRLFSFIEPSSNEFPISQRPLYIALYPSSSDSTISPLLSFPLVNYSDESDIITALQTNCQSDKTSIGEATLLSFHASPDIFLTTLNGCLFLTPDKGLAVNIARHDYQSLHDDVCFSTLERTSSKTSPASLFINVGSLDSGHFGLLSNHGLSTHGGAWTELDVDINNNILNANGFLTAYGNSFASDISSLKPKAPLTADNVVPSNALLFMSYAAADRQVNRDDDNCSDNVEVTNAFSDLFSSCFTLFSTSPSLTDSTHCCLAICATNGTMAQASLNTIITARRGIDTPAEVSSLSPVPTLTIPVYEALTPSDSLYFLQKMLPYIPRKFYLRYENTLLLADDINVLRNTLYEMLLSRTYANDATFRKLRSNLSSEQTFFAFCRGEALSSFVGNNLPASSSFYGIGVQLSSLSNMPYLSLCCLYEPLGNNIPPTLWQTKLDSTLVGKPVAVINHNTHETEYIVQDATNKIYLINPSGLILWSRKVDSPIIGDIRQIDYYNNKKLQYLFATSECVHLIDRNGNNTAKFPIHLPSKATGSVTYIDYGNPNEFRLFVPCEDKSILLYDKQCRMVEGWEMKHTEGIVRNSIDHWVTGNKDYLISTDNFHCYITDRRGNIRIALKPIAPNPNSHVFLVRANSSDAAFITSTADGKMASINVASSDIKFTPVDSIGKQQHFMLKLSNSDRFVFVNSHHFILTDDFGSTLSARQLHLSDVSWAAVTPSNLIAVWDQNESLGYLFNPDGNIVNGFPIPALSPFAISEVDGHTNIVVAGKDGILNNYIK